MVVALNLIGHQSSDPQGRVNINVVFRVIPDLRKASKGEEVTVVFALIAAAIVSPFQGLLKIGIEVGQTLGVGLELRGG